MGRTRTWLINTSITVQEHCIRAVTRKGNKDRQSKYNETLWRLRATIVAVKKQ